MISKITKQALDFTPPELLINRFCREHNTTEEEARERFEETKKFLILCANKHGSQYSPSKEIDVMWHEFILHTKTYSDFCSSLGKFVHHVPSEGSQPSNYDKTRKDLKKLFGVLNKTYWSENFSDCDECRDCTECHCV
jgi:hypothetical protein